MLAKRTKKTVQKAAQAEHVLIAASGKVSLRIPSSLHAALKAEAAEEGVSMNQLIVAKLAVTLKARMTGK